MAGEEREGDQIRVSCGNDTGMRDCKKGEAKAGAQKEKRAELGGRWKGVKGICRDREEESPIRAEDAGARN
jgi:hypothetical protein